MITPITASVGELLDAYLDGVDLLRRSVQDMTPDQLRARPVEGKLSSLEVLAHVVDSDQFMCDRVKRTIATPRPLIVGVESIDYPAPLGYQDRDPELDLRLLAVQREQLAADLRRLPEQVWERTGVHTENGTQTVREMFHHAVEHLEAHVEAIDAKRVAMGLEPVS